MYRYRNVFQAGMISGNALRSRDSLPFDPWSSKQKIGKLLALMKQIESPFKYDHFYKTILPGIVTIPKKIQFK